MIRSEGVKSMRCFVKMGASFSSWAFTYPTGKEQRKVRLWKRWRKDKEKQQQQQKTAPLHLPNIFLPQDLG